MTAIAALQFSHPEAGLTFDVDSAIAPETRRRVLDKLATDKLAVAGSHLPFPGFGHVETKAGAFAWEQTPSDQTCAPSRRPPC